MTTLVIQPEAYPQHLVLAGKFTGAIEPPVAHHPVVAEHGAGVVEGLPQRGRIGNDGLQFDFTRQGWPRGRGKYR